MRHLQIPIMLTVLNALWKIFISFFASTAQGNISFYPNVVHQPHTVRSVYGEVSRNEFALWPTRPILFYVQSYHMLLLKTTGKPKYCIYMFPWAWPIKIRSAELLMSYELVNNMNLVNFDNQCNGQADPRFSLTVHISKSLVEIEESIFKSSF